MFNNKLVRLFDMATYIILFIIAITIPLFVDKHLVNAYVVPKQYLFAGLILVALLTVAVKTVLAKRVEHVRSVIDTPIFVVLGLSLLSSLLAINTSDSFLGRNDSFGLNFIFIAVSALYYFLLVNYVRTVGRWQAMLNVLVAVGGVTATLFVLKSLFHLDLLAWIAPGIWNTVEKINSPFGLWLVIVFVLSAGQLIRKDVAPGKMLLSFFVMLVSLVSLVQLSFVILWWLLFAGILLLLLLGVMFIHESRLGWLSVLFSVLILTTVFIFFGTPKTLQSAVPVEVSLGIKPSWSVAGKVLFSGIKPFFIGNGLSSFGVSFSQFRPVGFNADQLAWNLRFSQPQNTFIELLASGGVTLALAFVFVVLLLLGHAFQILFKLRSENVMQGLVTRLAGIPPLAIEIFLVVVAWVVATIGMAFVFYGPTLWIMWWLLLGLTVSGLAFLDNGLTSVREWVVEESPQYSLSFSFLLIIVMAAVVLSGIFGARLYLAEMDYAKALQSNAQDAERFLLSALSKRSNFDLYHAALAQAYLVDAVQASQAAKPDVQAINTLMGNAVNEARTAMDLSPRSVMIAENLATMYENTAALIPGARDWAIKTLEEARVLESTNPVLRWRLGNNYAGAGKWEDAIKNYQAAIDLKQDYVAAYVSLAVAYQATNDLDKAVETYRIIAPAGINNSDYLFQFGKLLFNRNKGTDRADAEKLWLEAVRITPNFSNALYSLGLLNETKGNNTEALRYYYKVRDLNPDNKDIITKIKALVGGDSAPTPAVAKPGEKKR